MELSNNLKYAGGIGITPGDIPSIEETSDPVPAPLFYEEYIPPCHPDLFLLFGMKQ